MRFLVTISLAIVIYALFYSLITAFVVVPKKQTSKSIYHATIKKRTYYSFTDRLMMPVVKLLRFVVIMSEDRKDRLAYELKKVGIQDDPVTFEAKCLAKSLGVLVVGIFFYICGIQFLLLVCLGFAPCFYIKAKEGIKKSISMKKREISEELPFFARTFMSHIKSNNDVIGVLNAYYRNRAGNALKYELEITLSEMITSDALGEKSSRIRALENMDVRIGVPEMSDLIKGIIGVEKGENQSAYFDILEKNMKSLALNNLDATLKKYPKKGGTITSRVAVIGVMILLIPFGLYLLEARKMFTQ